MVGITAIKEDKNETISVLMEHVKVIGENKDIFILLLTCRLCGLVPFCPSWGMKFSLSAITASMSAISCQLHMLISRDVRPGELILLQPLLTIC